MFLRRALTAQSRRHASVSTVSPFTQIEGRWSKLPQAEQGALADQLAELQKGDWKKMTLEQKRAGNWIKLLNLFLTIHTVM